MTPLSQSEGSGAFEGEFLARVAGEDAEAVAQFAAHVRTVAWIWLKKNHPQRANRPGEVERLAGLACQAIVQSPEEWTVPGNLGGLLRRLCVANVRPERAGSGEVAIGAPADGLPDWLSGGYSESVRRLLDELPAKDRELLIGVFRQEERPRPDRGEGAYLRLLLFRARLRFRDLLAAAGSSSISPV